MGKIKYEEVKQSIEDAGWKLISKEYVNLKTDLLALCPKGHEVHFPFEDWRRNVVECQCCNYQPFKKINEKPKRKNGYRILAFDQASICSGWSCFDQDRLINYGSWTSHGTKSTERIAQTKAWFASMINQHNPDLIVLEDIQLQKFGDGEEAVLTFKKLAHLQGVLKNFCYENNFSYLIVAPGTWRTHNGIKGRTRTDQKKNAQLKVQSIYEIKVSTDEADAILLGRYAASLHQQQEVIEF